jgi:ABC-type transporter Mla MlaB component
LSAPELVLRVRGRIDPGDVEGLVARLRQLLDAGDGPVVCDVAGVRRPDVAAMDALARLQHAARIRGRSIRLRHARADLLELLGYCGLRAVVPAERGSSFEAVGQPEEREQRGRVEERVDPADPLA